MFSYINAFFCSLGIIMCVCRLGTKMSRDTTKEAVRFLYVILLGADSFLLLQGPIGLGHIILSGSIFVYLVKTTPAWRCGAPLYACKTQKLYVGGTPIERRKS